MALGAEQSLQGVVDARQVRHRCGVEQSGPVAPRHFAEVIDSKAEAAETVAVKAHGRGLVAQSLPGTHIARPAPWLGGVSEPARLRCRTLNWSACNAAPRERGSLTVWFDAGTAWHAAPSGRRGRRQPFSDAAISDAAISDAAISDAAISDAAIRACLTIEGEGRPGNDPVGRFSPERAQPRGGSACR